MEWLLNEITALRCWILVIGLLCIAMIFGDLIQSLVVKTFKRNDNGE